MSIKRRQQNTLMFGSDGEVEFNPPERVSQARIKSDDTLKFPAMTAEMVRKALPLPQKAEPDDRFTKIADGEALLDQLENPKESPQLTNEVFEALFSKQEKEDEEPMVPSRPAGEYPTFIRPTIETIPVSPHPETIHTSITAPIQQRQQLINQRTRSILAAVGIGVALGLAGVAAYDHYYESPNQKKVDL